MGKEQLTNRQLEIAARAAVWGALCCQAEQLLMMDYLDSDFSDFVSDEQRESFVEIVRRELEKSVRRAFNRKEEWRAKLRHELGDR